MHPYEKIVLRNVTMTVGDDVSHWETVVIGGPCVISKPSGWKFKFDKLSNLVGRQISKIWKLPMEFLRTSCGKVAEFARRRRIWRRRY